MSEQKVKKVRQKDVKIQDKMIGLLGFYSPEELKPEKESPEELKPKKDKPTEE